MEEESNRATRKRDVVIVGGGLTGLTLAHSLLKKGVNLEILERENRVGGQIQTFEENDFVFESGPNTGVISHPEVMELLDELAPHCELETANPHAKQRWIWKGNRFHALPSGPLSALTTPLFTPYDKLRILGEPWRPMGKNPNESVAELTRRRLGESFLNYAVDPFVSGIYAGDPNRLITRRALPRLHRLEQDYGSFIRGAWKKARMPKSERDRRATKEVFSIRGGLSKLIHALEQSVTQERITLRANHVRIFPLPNETWQINYQDETGAMQSLISSRVVCCVPSYELPSILPFISTPQKDAFQALEYASVVQVAVGIKHLSSASYTAFGGLFPSCEEQSPLGILFPSSCFLHRAPTEGMLLSFFLGGVRQPAITSLNDREIESIIKESMRVHLKLPASVSPDLIRIFRHERAIPQHDIHSDACHRALEELKQTYPNLVIAGGLSGGIGMADRIHQAVQIASTWDTPYTPDQTINTLEMK